jgi:hypothetical protein
MVEVIDRLTQVLLRTVWFKKRLALKSLSNSVGQMRRNLARHDLSFDHGKQSDERSYDPYATEPWSQVVRCVCVQA